MIRTASPSKAHRALPRREGSPGAGSALRRFSISRLRVDGRLAASPVRTSAAGPR